MDKDIFLFFHAMPDALPLYEAVKKRLLAEIRDAKVKVQKSQIAFYGKRNFAFVWLPVHRMKGRPDVYIILTFGLGRRVEHPRIVQAVEPYPNRWTHHVIIQSPEEIDAQLIEWVKEAYRFSSGASKTGMLLF